MSPAYLVQGDARRLPLADESVDLIITSPPYWSLRAYDTGDHKHLELGAEASWRDWLAALVACTAEMARVLKPAGSIFVNLGDKYTTGNSGESAMAALGERYRGGGHTQAKAKTRSDPVPDMPPKSLLLLPERYRIACVDQLGLIARAVITWDKPNALPEGVRDRVRRSHEDWVHLTKRPRYYSAVDEIREPGSGYQRARSAERVSPPGQRRRAIQDTCHPIGRVPGSVWSVATEPLRVPPEMPSHFAAFPIEWPRRLILGWSPPGICQTCGESRVPVVGASRTLDGDPSAGGWPPTDGHRINPKEVGSWQFQPDRTLLGYACSCCPHTDHREPSRRGAWREYHLDQWTDRPPTRPAVVLDPFCGTGTVPMVARALGRHGIGLDLSTDYLRLARWRITASGHEARALARTNAERQTTIWEVPA